MNPVFLLTMNRPRTPRPYPRMRLTRHPCLQRVSSSLCRTAVTPARHFGPATRAVARDRLNAYEAEAYCLWARRRLPTAVEWEHAAVSDKNFTWGHSVWEWTASAFTPYPGFQPGPYREYSQPWFGDHRELRGGAFATHARMHHPRYRNFFQPQRSDIFAGFRTAALKA